jgi:succinoglycan biosynthesis transport protein ExoP
VANEFDLSWDEPKRLLGGEESCRVSLDNYLSVLRKRWLTVFVVLIVSVLGAALYSFTATPQYTAHAKVFFSVSVSDSAGARSRGFIYQQTQVRTYAQLAVLPVVLDPVVKQLKLNTTPQKLADRVIARAPINTPIVEIVATASTRASAVAIAQAVANQLSTTVTTLAPKVDNKTPAVRATTVDEATGDLAPRSPRTQLNIVVGVIFGALAGMVLAIAVDARAERGRRRRKLEALGGVAVLGTVAMRDHTGRRRPTTDPTWTENLRQLQLQLFPPLRRRTFTTVAVTSASDAALSARLAAGLAIGQANGAPQRVLVIDGNLSNPSLRSAFALPAAPGLAGVLRGEVPLEAAVQRWGDHGLDVLAAGIAVENPTGLLESEAMKTVLRTTARQYDLVLISAPPFATADGLLLSRLADSAVVVVDAEENRRAFADTLTALRVARAQVLGLVVST